MNTAGLTVNRSWKKVKPQTRLLGFCNCLFFVLFLTFVLILPARTKSCYFRVKMMTETETKKKGKSKDLVAVMVVVDWKLIFVFWFWVERISTIMVWLVVRTTYTHTNEPCPTETIYSQACRYFFYV